MGGRGASAGNSNKMKVAKEIARELYGKNISDTVAIKYAKDIIQPTYQSGYGKEQGQKRSLSELKEWLKDLKNPS